MASKGLFVWEDNQKMACAFPHEVCVPGLPNLDGIKTPDCYGTIYIKSQEMLEIDRNEFARNISISGVDKDSFVSVCVPKILFVDKSSPDSCRNINVLNPYVLFGQEGVKVFLYYDWVMRGTATFENDEEINVIFLPFSTEPEALFDERIDDDIQAGFKELSEWEKFFIGDEG